MSKLPELVAGWFIILIAILVLAFAPGDEPPATPPWSFDPERVREAITPEIENALCPPYSALQFAEDGTFRCHPG